MSLQIIIDGKHADLDREMSILLERYNPMLDFDTIQGSSVLDFTLPFSNKNNAIFQNFGNRQVGYTFKEYLCEKKINGKVLERGFIQLNNADNGFSVFYSQNLGEMFRDYQNVMLNKLPMGSEAVPVSFTAAADLSTDKYCLPVIENSAFYSTNGAGISYSGYVNDYDTTTYTAGPKVPMLSVHWVLKRIGEICDFKFKGAFMDDVRMQRLIFYNTFSLDGATVIEYANHLPEMTIPDLLKELRKLFNLALFFDVWKRECTIDFVDDHLGKPVVKNWSKKFPPITRKMPLLHNRIELDWALDTGDDLMKDASVNFDKYTSPAENVNQLLFEVKTMFSTLEMNGDVPHAEQVGISEQFNQKSNKFTPRLLFWHGMEADMPTAKASYSDINLNWNGADGLRAKFWSKYEAFRKKTYSVETYASLNAYELSEIDIHRKAGETVAVHIQGLNYLIGSQKIMLPDFETPVLELWKL
jgi:hypothetical protein